MIRESAILGICWSMGKYRFHRFYCFWVFLEKTALGLFHPFIPRVLFTYVVRRGVGWTTLTLSEISTSSYCIKLKLELVIGLEKSALPLKGHPHSKSQLHTMSGSWKMEGTDFFLCETWSVICRWYWEIAICLCGEFTFKICGAKMFPLLAPAS